MAPNFTILGPKEIASSRNKKKFETLRFRISILKGCISYILPPPLCQRENKNEKEETNLLTLIMLSKELIMA